MVLNLYNFNKKSQFGDFTWKMNLEVCDIESWTETDMNFHFIFDILFGKNYFFVDLLLYRNILNKSNIYKFQISYL